MHRIKENLQFKKTSAGESGSALSMPLPDPGACHSDPAGASYMTYQEQLKSPKWQKKRLEIMERDGFKCTHCGVDDKQLNVHHLFYIQNRTLDKYPDSYLFTLCNDCHRDIHFQMDELECAIATFIEEKNGKPINYFKALRVGMYMSDEQIEAYMLRINIHEE